MKTLFLTILLLLWAPAQAAPPADANPELAPWFQGLRDNNGSSCCSIADCRHLPVRIGKDGYEVQVPEVGEEHMVLPTKHWIPVPPEKILPHKENPTGEPVTCWAPYRGIMCFVEGSGT